MRFEQGPGAAAPHANEMAMLPACFDTHATAPTAACRRLWVSSVCRRWHAIVLSPPLLATLNITVSGEGWLDTLRSGTAWLQRRVVGSVRQLTIHVNASRGPDSDSATEAAALIADSIAAVIAGSTVRELTIWAAYMPLPLDYLAAALPSLHSLCIETFPAGATISSGLQGLSVLHSMRLSNCGIAADAPLPQSLTNLCLEASGTLTATSRGCPHRCAVSASDCCLAQA